MTDIEIVIGAVEKFFAGHGDEGPVTVWTDGITFRGEFDQRVLALEILNALRANRKRRSLAKMDELLGDRRAKLTAADIGMPAVDED